MIAEHYYLVVTFLSKDESPLIKLARSLGKMTARLRNEMGYEAPPQPMKPLVRSPSKSRVVTPEQADQSIMAIANAYGIPTENRSLQEIQREITLRMGKKPC